MVRQCRLSLRPGKIAQEGLFAGPGVAPGPVFFVGEDGSCAKISPNGLVAQLYSGRTAVVYSARIRSLARQGEDRSGPAWRASSLGGPTCCSNDAKGHQDKGVTPFPAAVMQNRRPQAGGRPERSKRKNTHEQETVALRGPRDGVPRDGLRRRLRHDAVLGRAYRRSLDTERVGCSDGAIAGDGGLRAPPGAIAGRV